MWELPEMGHLPKRAANRKQNQLRTEKCIVVNKAERIWRSEKCFDNKQGNAESRVCPTGFQSYSAPFPPFWNGNVYSVLLYVGNMGSSF